MTAIYSESKIIAMAILLAACAQTEKSLLPLTAPVKAEKSSEMAAVKSSVPLSVVPTTAAKPIEQPRTKIEAPRKVPLPKAERLIEEPSAETEAILKEKIAKLESGSVKVESSSAKIESRAQEKCAEVYKRIVATLAELRVNSKIGDEIDVDILNLISIPAEQCNANKSAKETLKQISYYLKTYSSKIGVILPLSGKRASQANAIRNGLETACSERGVSFDDTFIVKDSGGLSQGTVDAMGALLLRDNVAMVITGFDEIEATVAVPLSKKLMLPVLIMNSKWELIKTDRYAFQVFPTQSQISNSILEILQTKVIKRVAILRPTNGKANLLIENLRKDFDNNGISLTHNLPYIDGDFDSMELAVKKIAGIDYVTRQVEYNAAYRQAINASKKAGVHFDSRSVILPANVQTDAVIIPDNFRVVRHFINLFKYHGIGHLALIGNHEWRSKALLEPWDNFLQGATFVDFVGTYDTLPQGIREQFVNSPFFLQPEVAGQLDFRLIGYHTGKIAMEIPLNLGTRKKDLASILLALKSTDGFYKSQNIFDQRRMSSWPTFHFMVFDRGLVQKNFVPIAQNKVSAPPEIR